MSFYYVSKNETEREGDKKANPKNQPPGLELFSSTNFNAQFFINNMLLHYYPRHVSGVNMPIFRRKDCIHTASGIFALCNVCTVHRLRVDSGGLLDLYKIEIECFAGAVFLPFSK
jgi:hypothetical protein